MIRIVSYTPKIDEGLPTEHEEPEVTFWFNPLTEQLFREQNGEMTIMGKPENFIFPNVPKPHQMRHYASRLLTVWCADWVFNHRRTA